jgi:hypothetical protein
MRRCANVQRWPGGASPATCVEALHHRRTGLSGEADGFCGVVWNARLAAGSAPVVRPERFVAYLRGEYDPSATSR